MSKSQEALDKLNKQFGKGTVGKLGQMEKQDLPAISTGSIGLDLALGVGGFPIGRIVEVFGPESSGKTTIAMHALANAQKNESNAAMIDMEHAFDEDYAKKLGIDVNELVFTQPDSGEQCLEILDALITTGDFSVIVVDSVAAMLPQDEDQASYGDSKMGLHARLMSQAMRKLSHKIHKNNVCVIFINQIRSKIGVMMGSPETTTGGNALKFYASQRLDIRRTGSGKDKGGNVVTNDTKVKIIKNKVAPPFKIAEFKIRFGEGIDKYSELLDFAVEMDIVKKSGSWYSYGDQKLGQGEEVVRQLLVDNPELFEEVEAKVLEEIG